MNNSSRLELLTAATTLRPARIGEAERLHDQLQQGAKFFWYQPVAQKGEVRDVTKEDKARPGDIPHGYFAPFSVEDMQGSIARGMTYVVDYATLVVAQGSLIPRGSGVYEIARIYTEPALRGNGFMRQIVGALENIAIEQGATEVRAVSKGEGLQGFEALGYAREPMPASRADAICNGCRIQAICPETALVKYVGAKQTAIPIPAYASAAP